MSCLKIRFCFSWSVGQDKTSQAYQSAYQSVISGPSLKSYMPLWVLRRDFCSGDGPWSVKVPAQGDIHPRALKQARKKKPPPSRKGLIAAFRQCCLISCFLTCIVFILWFYLLFYVIVAHWVDASRSRCGLALRQWVFFSWNPEVQKQACGWSSQPARGGVLPFAQYQLPEIT